MSGIILLVFLGVLVAFFFTRGRRKLGFPVTGKHWKTAILVFCIFALILWANNYGH